MRSAADLSREDFLRRILALRLLFVTGKGGVGKTTVASALASIAARFGRRVLLVSADGRGDTSPLWGRENPGYGETLLEPGLFALTASFEPLLTDFVRTAIPFAPFSSRILGSAAFRFFTRATPGLSDLLLLGKVREVLRREKDRRQAPSYDLVVIDGPATGHALSLAGMPRAIMSVVPAGPMRRLAHDLDAWLADPAFSAAVVVAEPAELPAREADELVESLMARAGLTTSLLVVNRVGRGERPETLPASRVPVVAVDEIPPAPGPHPGRFDEDMAFLASFRAGILGRAATPHPTSRRTGSLPQGSLSLQELLGESRLLVLLGPGGVGKTTLAAATGLAAALSGRRVLVLTVDPARRLAQALGIPSLPERPLRLSPVPLPQGASFSALQIDPRKIFERLLARIAPPATEARIRSNRLYDGLVDSFPGVVEYMGVEALAEYAAGDEFDLLILDTPPASRGLDFLDSPRRMVDLLRNDALRWFLDADSLLGRAVSGTARGAVLVLRMADNALGLGFLGDLADFFHAFDGLYSGFEARSVAVGRHLAAARFALVASIDRGPLRTAASLALSLARDARPTSLLLNRVAPGGGLPATLPPELLSMPWRCFAEDGSALAELPVRLAASWR